MQKKMEIKFFLSQIIASELAALSCVYHERNPCHGQSMQKQTVLRLCISLRVIFSNLIVLTVINEYDKGLAIQISTVLVLVHYAARRSIL